MNPVSKGKIAAIIGPTATGKTSAAVELASRFNGEIVSCDSVQIYRGLDIGSAKPQRADMERVPHHLIDRLDPDTTVDAWKYKTLAEEAILDILSRGRTPFLAGGTGMYFNSLYFGMFEGASRDDKVRKELEERAVRDGLGSLLEELAQIDPDSAVKILPNDKRRIVRALEAYRVTGVPLSRLRENNKKLDLDWLIIGLNMERKTLYARIDNRVDDMLRAGLIAETEALIATYGRDAHALQSIGYRHAAEFLDGRMDLTEMTELLKQDTRHYAKRQLTWFRKVPGVHWFNPGQLEQIGQTVAAFLSA
ncbi:MAG: tRNA (adenosine(37)-N6)-dimethylallyltransferase MiaA [Spirochaetes bacterium GWF1_51_8]|nr:MAG: tRNA (adenosine(37)-N6)-dimethylallyltransferase MiaA [Spirochaetes bacterium GWF1_51_8]